jgi:hypothetical protein
LVLKQALRILRQVKNVKDVGEITLTAGSNDRIDMVLKTPSMTEPLLLQWKGYALTAQLKENQWIPVVSDACFDHLLA